MVRLQSLTRKPLCGTSPQTHGTSPLHRNLIGEDLGSDWGRLQLDEVNAVSLSHPTDSSGEPIVSQCTLAIKIKREFLTYVFKRLITDILVPALLDDAPNPGTAASCRVCSPCVTTCQVVFMGLFCGLWLIPTDMMGDRLAAILVSMLSIPVWGSN